MAIKDKYSLADFNNYALAHNLDRFEAISDPALYIFKRKGFTDKRKQDRRERMLRVGRWFYNSGLQQVWARATGLRVDYYYGPRGADTLTPVADMYRSRIYYTEPFCFIAGAQDKGMSRARGYGQVVTETVINFLFLQRGLLVHVYNEGCTDMLSDFEHACINFKSRKEAAEDEERIQQEREDANEKEQAVAWGHGKRALAREKLPPVIKDEEMIKREETDDDVFPSASLFEKPGMQTRSPPPRPAGESPVIENILAAEANSRPSRRKWKRSEFARKRRNLKSSERSKRRKALFG